MGNDRISTQSFLPSHASAKEDGDGDGDGDGDYLLLNVLTIPRMELKLNTRRGRKLNGVKTTPAMIFHCNLSICGNNPWSESANRTTSATQAAISSSENKTDTHTRDL